ncbi:hypothetical protein EJ03DRAFT_217014 [Teratosphaeria nubilosa]|uniref:Uncharacterized protein n=1 Tax=Teratosphaeria nubilosa TaxID=161662 RepID=A0A6G1LII3_9PEZI|nr:hypothetical protein EJ03DRAFT_217014 [Teratosphaeria nubilosa]
MAYTTATPTGVLLSNGCRITHGNGADIKKPFPNLVPDLTMHELCGQHKKGFSGQLGFIDFNTDIRLPRHIHMRADKSKFIYERIMTLHGMGLVEIAGEVFVVPPGSLVDCVGGVPHTWTACPAGVLLPDGMVSEGSFTMVYEYEEPTSFFPTASTEIIKNVGQYQALTENLDDIRFPKLSAQEVVRLCLIDRKLQFVSPKINLHLAYISLCTLTDFCNALRDLDCPYKAVAASDKAYAPKLATSLIDSIS